MISLEIKYSIDLEIERVKYTLGKIEWYRTNRYKVLLPDGLDETSGEVEVLAATSTQFHVEDYKEYEDVLNEAWISYLSKLEEAKKILPFPLRDNYTVVFTKYGTGGSYYVDEGIVTLRFIGREKKGLN